VVGFQHRAGAEWFLQDWRERLRKFGLELHPDKTRLIEFGRIVAASRKQRGKGKPETFNFLEFTHICGQARKNGKFLVLRKTIRKRLQTERGEGRTSEANASAAGRGWEVVEERGSGLLQLSRSSRQYRQSSEFSAGGEQTLVAGVALP